MHVDSQAPPQAGWNNLLQLFDDLPSRTLLQMAHHCDPENEDAVALVLSLTEAGVWLQNEKCRVLDELRLTERDFRTLGVLYTLHPVPVSAADLAFNVRVSRATMSGTVSKLEKSGDITRTRKRMRRGATHVSLTERGRVRASHSLNRVLENLTVIGKRLPTSPWVCLTIACAELRGLQSREPRGCERPANQIEGPPPEEFSVQ